MPGYPVKASLLTRAELDELSAVERSGSKTCARRQKQIAWSLIGIVFAASSLWVYATQGGANGYHLYHAFLIGLLVTAISGFFLSIGAWSVAEWLTDPGTSRHRHAYLIQIGYPQRYEDDARQEDERLAKFAQRKATRSRSVSHDDYDSQGPTYPVTDGQYDPDLYRRRGGYATYSGMADTDIDDYDTYKNNVLEAE